MPGTQGDTSSEAFSESGSHTCAAERRRGIPTRSAVITNISVGASNDVCSCGMATSGKSRRTWTFPLGLKNFRFRQSRR